MNIKREKNNLGLVCRKNIASALSVLLSMLLLTGCAEQNKVTDSYVKDSVVSDSVRNDTYNSGSAEIAVCTLDTSDMFSDRDKEVGYDEAADVTILLNGDTATCTSAAVQIEGNTVTITDEGTYILSGTLNNGSIVVEAEDSDKLQLVLNGVDITCESSAAIYIKQADKVFITLAPGTENRLETSGEFVAIDDNNIDAVIFSKDDLTLNGSGSLTLACAYGHGIVSKDDLVFTGGNYQIDAASHGISGKDSVRIAAGSFQITAQEDGIHSENDDDATLGFVYIADGVVNINVGDDGIHAGNQVLIENGTINITKCEEGIEGLTVDLAGGDVTIMANDDAINATDGSSSETTTNMPANPFAVTANAYIKISGGVVKITAYGDGIDSNGALYVTGGETYVSGPENSGNGSIDYASAGIITGGIFVAAGPSGMAMNFGSNSTQCVMMVNLNTTQQAGSTITLSDTSGKQLVSFTPETKYNCVIVSTPDMQTGNRYTLTAGDESSEIEMTDIVYGSGGMMGGHGGMGGRMPGGNGGMGGQMPTDRGDMTDEKGGRPGGKRGQWDSVSDGDMQFPELPEDFNGEMPQMPEGGFNGEMPQMPEGGMNGQMPAMPQDGQLPQM